MCTRLGRAGREIWHQGRVTSRKDRGRLKRKNEDYLGSFFTAPLLCLSSYSSSSWWSPLSPGVWVWGSCCAWWWRWKTPLPCHPLLTAGPRWRTWRLSWNSSRRSARASPFLHGKRQTHADRRVGFTASKLAESVKILKRSQHWPMNKSPLVYQKWILPSEQNYCKRNKQVSICETMGRFRSVTMILQILKTTFCIVFIHGWS